MRNKYLIGITFILLSTSFSCTLLTGPSGDVQPGRRDYVWTVDTLSSSIFLTECIWGSSASDVWLGAYGANSLFHYDGNKWEVWNGAPANHSEVDAIYGSGPNDAWLATYDNEIWHFDGNRWSEAYRYKASGSYHVPMIKSVWGTSASDVYACGTMNLNDSLLEGFILHNNGDGWKEVYRASSFSDFVRVRVEDGTAYILSADTPVNEPNPVVSFYGFRGGILKKIYSGYIYNTGLSDVGGKVYFMISGDVCRYIPGNLQKVFSVTSANFAYNLYGRSEKDVFVSMYDGLSHWNGTDLQYLSKFSNTPYVGSVAVFPNDFFAVSHDMSTGKNMVHHGRLGKEGHIAKTKTTK